MSIQIKEKGWTKKVVLDNLFFVPGFLIALGILGTPNWELASIKLAAFVFSSLKNRNIKLFGVVSKGEVICSKTVFLYGFVQIFYSPTIYLCLFHAMLCFITLLWYVHKNFVASAVLNHTTNFMLFFPGVWTFSIASSLTPIFQTVESS